MSRVDVEAVRVPCCGSQSGKQLVWCLDSRSAVLAEEIALVDQKLVTPLLKTRSGQVLVEVRFEDSLRCGGLRKQRSRGLPPEGLAGSEAPVSKEPPGRELLRLTRC